MENRILFWIVLNMIVNVTAIFVVVLIMAYKSFFSRFALRWRKTFWSERKYGFDVTLWERPVGVIPNQGRSIFWFHFISEKLANKNDYADYLSAKQRRSKGKQKRSEP